MKFRILLALLSVAILFLHGQLSAAIPELLNYQGRLTDSSNNPVSDGEYTITFSIYGSESDIDDLWNSGPQSILVINGLFNVQLGAAPMPELPAEIFNAYPHCYLGIQIDSNPEMLPRIALTASAYSFKSLNADTASYAHNLIGGSGSGWTDDGNEVYLSNVNDSVGIGTDNPQAKLHVQTPSTTAKLGTSSYGVYGEHPMTGSYGYLGAASIGTFGYSNNLYGVQGNTNTGYGVWGAANDNAGTGIYGTNIVGNYAALGRQNYALFAHAANGHSGYFEGKVYMNDKLGLHVLNPINTLDVGGKMVIGNSYAGIVSAPDNSLVVEGKIGAGVQSLVNGLDVATGVAIGADYAGVRTAPTSGLIVQDKVGIGTYNPWARLNVVGNLYLEGTEFDLSWKSTENFEIGVYDGQYFTERFRLTPDGKMGIGTSAPQDKLQVKGNVRLDSGTGNGNFLRFVENGTMRWSFLHRPWATSTFALRDETGERDVMSFKSDSGFVGINNTDPSSTLDVGGDLEVTGAFKGDKGPDGGAPFPRPAYNSGWVSISPGQTITLTHNVGVDVNKYFVDLTFQSDGAQGIHQIQYGGYPLASFSTSSVSFYGASWKALTTTTIQVVREADDLICDKVRVRIWFIE